MLKLADRVKETSITVGNGLEIALAGAFGAFQTFASTIGDGNSTYYTIENNSNFEVGVGTYNANNNTLSRDLVFSSTNNNQRISLDGVSIVFCCYPASQAVLLDNGRINSPSPNYNGIVFPSSTVIDTALLSGIVSTSILPTSIVYSNDSRLSDSRNPNPHTHPISDITTLQNALDSKQPTGSYASSVHSHVVSDVQNLQSSLDSKQASGNYALFNHQHLIADVSGLQSALNNKQASGSYASSTHTHLASDITDFASAVNTYAPPTVDASLLTTGVLSDSRLSNNIVRTTDARLSDARTPLSHNHNISDVSGLQTALDSKQASGNYASSNHTHAISSVSGLQSALDGKQASGSYAALSHTHTASNITDFNSSVSGLVSGVYAPLSSPTLTGVPLTPTASSGTNTNQIASTSFVRTEISNLVASAPSTLDTLNELALALGSDANFSTTVASGLGSKAALSGAIFTGNISAPSGNFTSLTVSGIPLINGGYDYEIHVSQIDGNDTTGNGDLLNPVASITKALTLVGSQRKTIIVHPGTYTENPSITVQYTTITGPGLIGGNIVLSGTLSTNTGCTIAGIKMTNLTIATPTGAGNVNILNCEISGTLTKSSNADYTVLRLCDYGSASITGAGLVAIFGGNPNFTTVNNASANIIIKSAVTVAPVLTSGTLSLVDSIVVAAVTNAITSASSSIITLANCQMLTSALSNVAPVVLSGFYSILNCVYDKTNSTLVALSATGGSTNSIDYFQYINADKFITQGGTSSQYLRGDGSLAFFNSSVINSIPINVINSTNLYLWSTFR